MHNGQSMDWCCSHPARTRRLPPRGLGYVCGSCPGREKAPSNPSLLPAQCSSGLLVRAHLRPGSPAPCGTGSGGPVTRPKTSTAPQLRYCPPATIPEGLVSGDPAPLGRSAPLSEEFGASRLRVVPRSASTYRRSDRRSTAFLRKIGTTPKPLPCNETSPTTLRTRRPCGTTWDNPVNNGPPYPQRARQCGSGLRRSPVDSAGVGPQAPSASGGQAGV
jgi:hypothetical protein